MRNRCRFALLFALLLPAACAVEEPYPPWPSPPSVSLSPGDVVKLLLAGIPEDDVFAAIRTSGISARPTTEEIQALRLIGASDRLLAGILSAALVHSVPRPAPNVEGPMFPWLPPPPLPGCWPVDPWLWLEGTLNAVPRPAPPIEAEP